MSKKEVDSAQEALKYLNSQANARDAQVQQRFFKTGPGEYGEGDRFLGVRVPVLRSYAKRCDRLALPQIKQLLNSDEHEARLLALIIMRRQFEKGDSIQQEKLFRLYMSQLRHVNNWDLVDASATYIVGAYLQDKDRAPLYQLIGSRNMWRRRVAIMASFHFIRNHEFDDTLNLVTRVLRDKEDLLHKAAGWMLREVAKRDSALAESYLKAHLTQIPRTMLRYAIEKFGETKRKAYLCGNISCIQ